MNEQRVFLRSSNSVSLSIVINWEKGYATYEVCYYDTKKHSTVRFTYAAQDLAFAIDHYKELGGVI